MEGKVYEVAVAHRFKENGLFNPTKRRHDCLNNGWWCWQNFLRHPQDIKGYLRNRAPNTTVNKEG